MSSISIIGSGNMASAIGTLAVKGGSAVEVIGRDAAKAADLAERARQRRHSRNIGSRPGRRHRHPRRDVRQRRAGRQTVRGRAGRQDHRRHHQPLQRQRHRAGHPRRHLHRADGRQGRPRKRPCGQGVQHPLPRRAGRGRPAGCVHGRRRRAGEDTRVGVHREPGTAPDGRRAAANGAGTGERRPAGDGPRRQLHQAHQLFPRRQHSRADRTRITHHHATIRRTVTCTFSSLAGPAIPVRTSFPS